MERPLCSCGNLCKKGGRSVVDGRQLYTTYCRSCGKAKQNGKERRWRDIKKGYCESCGFIPEHSCQLDLDHIDGDRENNVATNHQTLCANCHRLKTYRKKDWKPLL